MMNRQTLRVREDDQLKTEERTEYQQSTTESRVNCTTILLAGRKRSKDDPPYRLFFWVRVCLKTVMVGNFILGRAAFDSEAPPDVVERVTGRLKDRHVIIINSPQLLQTNISDHQITQTVRECVHLP
ncbi:hypothetical protein QQF64_026104 [Cirrhinus molitorella]|uniref:Uncharacterized protein n=1 Tax=Cirrhinus molitorella TaxID=172907 RepID=A0ABR3NQX6_9TELE